MMIQLVMIQLIQRNLQYKFYSVPPDFSVKSCELGNGLSYLQGYQYIVICLNIVHFYGI